MGGQAGLSRSGTSQYEWIEYHDEPGVGLEGSNMRCRAVPRSNTKARHEHGVPIVPLRALHMLDEWKLSSAEHAGSASKLHAGS